MKQTTLKQTTLNWSSPRKAAEPPGDSAAGSPQLQIRRSFSQIWSDEEKLEVDEEILEESLTAGLNQKRKWEPAGTYSRRSGGRLSNEKLGLEWRGTAGGWGSNRLYAGMERRRKDYSAAEGDDSIQLYIRSNYF